MSTINMVDDKPEELPDHHIIVKFGKGISSDHQSRTMFAMELWLREQGVPAEVFKETKEDDSKLRRNMTPEQRARL